MVRPSLQEVIFCQSAAATPSFIVLFLFFGGRKHYELADSGK